MRKIKILYGILLLFVGLAFGGCGKESKVETQVGVHKVVIKQFGDLSDFKVRLTIGAAGQGGFAKLYDEKGDYLGDSYSTVLENSVLSCQTSSEAFNITCSGSVSSSTKGGKRLNVVVVLYVNDREVKSLEREYVTRGDMLVESFLVSSGNMNTLYDAF